jgi:hypothetical protein
MDISLDWKLTDFPGGDVGNAISATVFQLARSDAPELADLYPLKICHAETHFADGWCAVRISELGPGATNVVSELKGDAVNELQARLDTSRVYSHAELSLALGKEWFGPERFSCVGPHRDGHLSWPHMHAHIIDWLNASVAPVVLGLNRGSRLARNSPAADLRCRYTSRRFVGARM